MATNTQDQLVYMVDGKLRPLGYQQNNLLNTVQGLSPPPNSRVCIIQAATQNIRWRDDGIDPTANSGMILAAGRDMLYTGDLAKIRFIEEAASSELNIAFYA